MRARDTGLVRPPYDHLLPPEILWRRRRDLLASGLRISRNLAPAVHERIEQARTLLGVDLPVEAFQFASSSPEVVNAGFWGHGDAVILSFDGQLLARFEALERKERAKA